MDENHENHENENENHENEAHTAHEIELEHKVTELEGKIDLLTKQNQEMYIKFGGNGEGGAPEKTIDEMLQESVNNFVSCGFDPAKLFIETEGE